MATSRATPESGRGQDYGHNYIVDGRFNASGPGYRGVYVARIQRRFGEEDLMRNDRAVTMVFYLDQRVLPQAGAIESGEHDTLTHREFDIVSATFADAGQ